MVRLHVEEDEFGNFIIHDLDHDRETLSTKIFNILKNVVKKVVAKIVSLFITPGVFV